MPLKAVNICILCLTRGWPVKSSVPPVKFSHNRQFGLVEPVKLEFCCHRLTKFAPKNIHQITWFCLKNTKFSSYWGGTTSSDTPCARKNILFKVELLKLKNLDTAWFVHEGRLCRIISVSVVQIPIVHHTQLLSMKETDIIHLAMGGQKVFWHVRGVWKVCSLQRGSKSLMPKMFNCPAHPTKVFLNIPLGQIKKNNVFLVLPSPIFGDFEIFVLFSLFAPWLCFWNCCDEIKCLEVLDYHLNKHIAHTFFKLGVGLHQWVNKKLLRAFQF